MWVMKGAFSTPITINSVWVTRAKKETFIHSTNPRQDFTAHLFPVYFAYANPSHFVEFYYNLSSTNHYLTWFRLVLVSCLLVVKNYA